MISPSGNNSIRSAARKAPRLPAVAKAEQSVQSQDLVEITGGTTTAALKVGAKSALGFVVKNGLPMLGAAVAGLPGLAAGAILSSAATYLSDRSPGESKIPWGPLGTSVIAATSNLAGPLGPLILSGLTATGAVVSGVLEADVANNSPDFKVNTPKLARAYHNAVSEKLKEAGHSVEELGKPPGFSITAGRAQRKAQLHLAKTALLAAHHLGPGVAMAIAGELGREGVDSKAIDSLSSRSKSLPIVSSEVVDGINVKHVDDLKAIERSDAIASYNSVYLDSEYQAQKGEAKTDFLLGHEFSHIKHNDTGAGQIQNALIDAVRSTKRMTGSSQEITLLNELDNQLEAAKLAESREIEYRADQDGLAYALGKKHAKKDILQGAAELFSSEGNDAEEFRAHPDASKRLKALD